MPGISALYIYPVKSLGGIKVTSANITARGLQYDRRWMLVDENNRFLTQRDHPEMALLKTKIESKNIIVYHISDETDRIKIPLEPDPSSTELVEVWEDKCLAQPADDKINQWFSKKLGIYCKAVYMPDESLRPVDSKYAKSHSDITSFSDAYPMLLISEASLEDLNSRLDQPVPMDRFRPNLVIDGVYAYAEDEMQSFSINGNQFYGVKLCGRCIVTTTDQMTGVRAKEPLKTLATYRNFNGKVCFGQNVICGPQGIIRVNDEVIIEQG